MAASPDDIDAAENDADLDVEIELRELFLSDGQCWISDPDYLPHDSQYEGLIAAQFSAEAGLFYIDGRTRKWVNVEAQPKSGKLAAVKKEPKPT